MTREVQDVVITIRKHFGEGGTSSLISSRIAHLDTAYAVFFTRQIPGEQMISLFTSWQAPGVGLAIARIRNDLIFL